MCKCNFCGVLRDDLMYHINNIIICEDCLDLFKKITYDKDDKNERQ